MTAGIDRQESLGAELRAAARAGDVAEAGRLVAAGADVNARDRTGLSAFLVSTQLGDLDLVELMLANGGDVTSLDQHQCTGLTAAAEHGHAAVVGRLVRAGIVVDHVNRFGWTALHEAIVLGDGSTPYVDTVRVLAAAGADLSLPSRRGGLSPLEHAEARGFEVVAATLRAGLRTRPLRSDQADAALLAAGAAGDADGVAVAIRAGADLEARDAGGRTTLLLAVIHDQLDLARLLVALGADPNAVDDLHDTPWLFTGETGSVPMVEVLLAAKPDLALRNRFGGISIIPASERGHVAYVRRVVRTGIDLNHVNNPGWTALLEAVILGDGSERYQQVVAILLLAGADPELADADGVTALQHARRRGHDAIIDLLDAATGDAQPL
jgi:uncharacterized protein